MPYPFWVNADHKAGIVRRVREVVDAALAGRRFERTDRRLVELAALYEAEAPVGEADGHLQRQAPGLRPVGQIEPERQVAVALTSETVRSAVSPGCTGSGLQSSSAEKSATRACLEVFEDDTEVQIHLAELHVE